MTKNEMSERPIGLRTEFENEPANVVPDTPRFSWRVESEGRGRRQTACQILVARSQDAIESNTGTVWDSGRIEASRSAGVVYDGAPLAPDETYYWTVRVWDERGEVSPYADPAQFSTALASEAEWGGTWIGHQPAGGDSNGWRSRWHLASAGDADAAESPATEWVQIDLGERHHIATVELGPANPFDGPETPDGREYAPLHAMEELMPPEGEPIDPGDGTGFGFPPAFRIEVADDPEFDEVTTVVDRTGDPASGSPDECQEFDIDAAGRYVRVSATECYEFDPTDLPLFVIFENKPALLREETRSWKLFALASLAVRDDEGTDLARGCPVTASSSVEESGWGRAKLVDGHPESTVVSGSPLLRTDVHCSKPVARARLHAATLGAGECYLNGEKVGDSMLDPAWTDYNERVLYSTYDVTDRLAEGKNALGVWLGRGRFSASHYLWTGFGSPRARVHLSIEYEDGTTTRVVSEPSWRASESPILENDIYDGETYDARRERPGWSTPEFDDSEWAMAAELPAPGGDLRPQRTPPIRVTDEFDPESVTTHENEYVIDFGQNLTGWVALTIRGASEGERVVIRHAERLDDEGRLQTADLGDASATDTYIARGDVQEYYEPRFTYHGFRYVSVAGYPGDLGAEDITAKVVHTDLGSTGSFECSNEDLNRVQHAARWSLKGNVHGIPTDCPQRAERFGWTGDAHLAANALAFNFDTARFHEKWTDDHDDTQSAHGYVADTIPYGIGSMPGDPTWTATRVLIPWTLYRHNGDERVLRRHYEGMRRYVDFWYSLTEDGTVPRRYGNYGDWLAFEAQDTIDERRGTPFDLFNTAYHYRVTEVLSRVAGLLGHDADAARYEEHSDGIADAFHDRFFDSDAGRYTPGTQAAQAVPLFFDLVPDEDVAGVVEYLAQKVREEDDGKLRTGFLGTRALIHALADYGHADLAYEVVSQPDQPGWVHMIRGGSTTLWERWDSEDRIGSEMNSFNHAPLAMVSEWFYRVLAGIRLDPSDGIANDLASGFDHVEIAPAVVAGLDWARGEMRTPHGRLVSRWENNENELTIDVTVPWNTSTTLRVPVEDESTTVHETGTDDADGAGETLWADGPSESLPDGITEVAMAGDTLRVEVGSGTYRFLVH